jgi:cytochrome bd-type quinol oxidase subunit 2
MLLQVLDAVTTILMALMCVLMKKVKRQRDIAEQKKKMIIIALKMSVLAMLLFAMILTKKEIQSKQILWRTFTSLLSLGFCKICFSMVSGLSAFAERSSKEIALVYTRPDNSDMLVAAIVLGLLAPAIAFSIASGSGLAAF